MLGGKRVREVLVISEDSTLIQSLRLILEGAGYLVSISESLERSFLEVGRTEPYLVVVDGAAVPEEMWLAKDFLGWLHHRSPVILMSNSRCEELAPVCDRCLPRGAWQEDLVQCIRELNSH